MLLHGQLWPKNVQSPMYETTEQDQSARFLRPAMMSVSIKNFRCPVRNHHSVFGLDLGIGGSVPVRWINLQTPIVSKELFIDVREIEAE